MTLIKTADDLLAEMRGRDKEVYRSRYGTWHLTFTKDVQVSYEAVKALIQRGIIRLSYSDCQDSYTMGQTLDVKKTLEARKLSGDRHARIYVPI